MRLAISYALHHPERVDAPVGHLDLATVGTLTFEPVDHETFPCLRLAREAAAAGGIAPCVLNAANEIAVHAFLGERLAFGEIPRVIDATLERLGSARVHSFETLYAADRQARETAAGLVRERAAA
jgi:1-deoxy-D-xylulose-5-phosphate reductoisomerase